ncbi:NADH-quinone oxidoreductase subunit NuoN [Lysobacter pythonis]|uniref:NADH-quinone oxidoreductase subunit N n=1 Tax=Solilutibacter pythonis TaxID=2483112 RepID=A0A3M2I8I3_9GAMM|nr:NADH-quinone oxidoreductase subunit NuoN [Lysobacter pythonis]RMH94797.1 NADH-quinone oxidoreductase subunit NuoN [Lysobacter pythonis]
MDITLHVFDSAELWHLLPELVLAASAFALLLFDLFFDPKQKGITHWLAMVVLVVVGWLAIAGVGGRPADGAAVLNGMFVRDGLADLAKGVMCFVSAGVFVYALPYLRERGIYKGEVPVLMLFATLGMMLLSSAGNLVMVYVGLEMLALCSYALVAVDRDNPLATEAGMKYFVLGALASGILLYGMSLVYGATASLDLPAIHAAAAAGGEDSQMLLAGMAFMVAGIAFKLGAAPFHMWLPDVYQGAPTPITQFIGAAPKLAAFVMAYRLLEAGLGPVDGFWRVLVGGLAALSLVVGNLMALAQTNLKRMLAYSTVSHIGFLLMGLAGGGAEGQGAALFYAVVYVFTTLAAFGAIVLMSRQGFEAEEIADYRGLARRDPWMAFLILCIMASLAGVPPFIGFFAKIDVIAAAINGGMLWLAIVGIVFAVIGAFYYLRVMKVMYFETSEGEPMTPRDNRAMRTLFAVNALLLLALALGINPILEWCRQVFLAA